MKITGYQPSVTTTNTVNAAIKTVGDAMAYGGNGDGLKAIGQAANQWAAVIQKQQDEEDRQAVLQAMDAYNKGRYNIMYNDESGLMNTVAEGSNGISQSYVDQEKELRDGVMKSVKLHSRRNALALEHLMNKSAQEGFQAVDRHQYKQGEKVKDLTLSNNILNEIEYVQKNPLSLQNSFDRVALLIGARYSGMQGGPELTEAKIREAQSQIVGAAVDAAMQDDDTELAQQITAAYGHFLTPEQRASFGKVIKSSIETKEQFAMAQALYSQYGDDLAGAYAAIDAMNFNNVEPQAEGTTWVKNNGVSLEGAQENTKNGLNYIAKTFSDMGGGQLIVTSGTDSTNIHAAGQRSHGGGWKLDVAADWLENADNRKAYIKELEAKGIRVLDEYSNPSPNSTGGHLDLDFTDYTGGSMDSLQTYKKREAMKKWYKNFLANKKSIERYENDRLFDSVTQQLFEMKTNGVSYEAAQKWAAGQAGTDYKKLVQYKAAVGAIFGGSGNNSKGIGTPGKDRLLDMLREGKFSDKGTFLNFARSVGANDADMDALNKGYGQYLKGEGIFRYNFENLMSEIIGDKLKDAEKKRAENGVTAYLKNYVRKYRNEHGGTDPNEIDLIQEGQKSLQTKVYGQYITDYGTLWDSTARLSLSDAQLARAGIAAVAPVEGTSDMYEVQYSDGRIGGVVNGEYLQEVAGGY